MGVFKTIVYQAGLLAYAYPKTAESYRQQCETLQWVRKYAPEEVPSERKNLHKTAANGEEYRKLLLTLVSLVRVNLPDVYSKLRVVPEVGPWHTMQDFDWDAAIGELRTIEAAAAQSREQPAEPKTFLWNWKEILDAVGVKDNTESRRQVRRLNDEFDGPIVVTKSGSRPRVDKAKLVTWWNRLDDLHLELQQQARDKRATVADSYNYGSEGTVVPDLAGAVKKRRRDAKR
jgi:hypothetical protein